MALYFDSRNSGYRKRTRKDIVGADTVEETRERFGLQKSEIAELMGMSGANYSRCLTKGKFLLFRFYAALDAIENVALNKAIKDVSTLHKMKSGLKLINDDELVSSNDDDNI